MLMAITILKKFLKIIDKGTLICYIDINTNRKK